MMECAGHAAYTKETRNAYKILLRKYQGKKITKETQEKLKLYLGNGLLTTEGNRGQAQSVRMISVWQPRPARCGHLL